MQLFFFLRNQGGADDKTSPDSEYWLPSTARKDRIFTLDELSKYDGVRYPQIYTAINGIVYDMTNKVSAAVTAVFFRRSIYTNDRTPHSCTQKKQYKFVKHTPKKFRAACIQLKRSIFCLNHFFDIFDRGRNFMAPIKVMPQWPGRIPRSFCFVDYERLRAIVSVNAQLIRVCIFSQGVSRQNESRTPQFRCESLVSFRCYFFRFTQK